MNRNTKDKKAGACHYAYLICLCGILCMFCVGAVAGSVAVYLPYMIEYGGLTQTQGSSIFTIICMVSLVMTGVLLEPYYKWMSYRTGLAVAVLGAAADFWIYSCAKSYAGFVLGAIVGGAVYTLAGVVPVTIVINTWFSGSNAFVMGLCASGTGIASITIPLIVEALIHRYSLSVVFRCMALLMVLLAGIVYLLLRDHPEQLGLNPFYRKEQEKPELRQDRQEGSRTGMILMLAGMLLLGAVTGGGYQHLSVLYVDAGFTDWQVSRLLSLGGLLMIAGKCVFGTITDRIGIRSASRLFLVLLTAGWILCCMANRKSMLLAGMSILFVNLGMALSTVGLSALAKSTASEESFGRTVRNFQSAIMLGSIAFNIIPGMIADATGSYLPAYWIVTAITIASMGCIQMALAMHRDD